MLVWGFGGVNLRENYWRKVLKWLYKFLDAGVYFFFLQYRGLNSGPSPWATPPTLVLWRVFWDRVWWTICPGSLQTAILLISASWVARITDVSHGCPALGLYLIIFYYIYFRLLCLLSSRHPYLSILKCLHLEPSWVLIFYIKWSTRKFQLDISKAS
jgi:hypothetical protein